MSIFNPEHDAFYPAYETFEQFVNRIHLDASIQQQMRVAAETSNVELDDIATTFNGKMKSFDKIDQVYKVVETAVKKALNTNDQKKIDAAIEDILDKACA